MDFATAIAFYEGALETGTDAGTKVGWAAGEGYQLANFVTLCEVDGLVDGVSVLDVGCGLGALLDYFAAIGRRVDYVGVDISAKSIEAARARHPTAVFELRDILVDPPPRRFDFVLCSGTLNYRVSDHARWVAAMISRMYELADRAAVFNLPSAAIPRSMRQQLVDDPFMRMWPEDVVRYGRTLTPHVSLSDAWAGTFEVVLRRPRSGEVAALVRTLGVTDGDGPLGRAVIEVAFRRRQYAELRDVLRTFPATANTVEWIARTQVALGDRTAALADYARAATLGELSAESCATVGRLHFELGDDAQARHWFRAALSRKPDEHNAHYGIVMSLLRTGERESARAAVLAMAPGPLRDLLDARTATEPDAILAAYERALAAAPRLLDALAGAAIAYEERQRWREAASLWERAIDIAGDDPRVRERLVRARARAGHA